MYVEYLYAIVIGYFLGSTPYGLVLVKLLKGIDLRTVGSKNIGATNVYRSGFKWLALITLLLDLLKGLIAAVVAKYLFGYHFMYFAGTAAVIGHIFPVWLKFKGGKGVATSIGVMFIFGYEIALIFCITWFAVFKFSRYSSLAALFAFAVVSVVSFFIVEDLTALIAINLISLLSITMHKSNIIRLINKEEGRFDKSWWWDSSNYKAYKNK